MTDKLQACPFCGGVAEFHRQGNDHCKKQVAIVECKTFGCFGTARVGFLTGRSSFEWAKEKVFERWNTRAPTSAHTALKSALPILGSALSVIKDEPHATDADKAFLQKIYDDAEAAISKSN